jgi:hypothetical protein
VAPNNQRNTASLFANYRLQVADRPFLCAALSAIAGLVLLQQQRQQQRCATGE